MGRANLFRTTPKTLSCGPAANLGLAEGASALILNVDPAEVCVAAGSRLKTGPAGVMKIAHLLDDNKSQGAADSVYQESGARFC